MNESEIIIRFNKLLENNSFDELIQINKKRTTEIGLAIGNKLIESPEIYYRIFIKYQNESPNIIMPILEKECLKHLEIYNNYNINCRIQAEQIICCEWIIEQYKKEKIITE